MKAINYRVISVGGYVMNVCNLGKSNLNKLDMIGKSVLRRERYHGRKSSDERLHSKRKEGGRELKSFKMFMMKHGSNNNRINKGSMEKRKPERINITQKGNRKSNEKGRSNCII